MKGTSLGWDATDLGYSDIEAALGPITGLNGGKTGIKYNNYNHNKDEDKRAKYKLLNNYFNINKFTSTQIFVLLIFIWYIAAMVALTTSKMIMIRLPLPSVLCYSQFLMASIAGNTYINCFKSSLQQQQGGVGHGDRELGAVSPSPTSTGGATSSKGVTSAMDIKVFERSEEASLLWKIAVSFNLGFLLTNAAFSLSTVSFAETIKAGEPVCVVLLSRLFLSETPQTLTLLALLIIVIGVATSCIGDYHFVWFAFFLAIASNFCFAGRAVLSKKFFMLYPGPMDEMRGLGLFTRISEMGCYMVMPIALIFEGRTLYSYLLGNGVNANNAINTSSLAFVCMLFIINSLAYSTYNLTSFLVLARTDVITHAILNIFRRVVVILFSTFIFGLELSRLNTYGILLAITGGLIYSGVKKKKEKGHEKYDK